MRNKLESLLRNTQRTFVEFGGLLSENDQLIAERVLSDGETAVSSTSPAEIGRALDNVERLAKQLTNVMMDPSGAATDQAEGSH